MTSLRFSELRDDTDAAKALGTSREDLLRFANPLEQSRLYERIQIRKRRRPEFRTVYKVDQELALLQKNLATAVVAHTDFPEYVQGFVSKRSIVTNARLHLGQKILLHADVQNFFESITLEQVKAAFVSLGCIDAVGTTLGRVCTLDGILPQGSSASPVIANLVCRLLDADLQTLAVAHGCRYSRYGDDITISGATVPAESRVAELLQRHGFVLRDGKCRTQRRGRNQYVTGLTVFDTSSPRISRRAKRRLRLELYYAERFGLRHHHERAGRERSERTTLNRLGGWISFMFSVESASATKFYQQWKRIRNGFDADAPTEGD